MLLHSFFYTTICVAGTTNRIYRRAKFNIWLMIPSVLCVCRTEIIMAITRTLNKSRQRDAILNYLLPRKDHPTADTIYNAVKEDFPNISLGTVYRNLSLLAELGIIQKISCGDDSEHFDGNPKPHNHFICSECYSVIDLEMENIDFIDTLAATNFNGKISGHNIYFYGKCPNCLKEEVN